MGFLGGLFGRSNDRKRVVTDRCMECGMTEGTHTNWCSASARTAATPSAETSAPQSTPEEASEPPRPM